MLYPDHTVQHLGITFTLTHPKHLYSHFPKNHPLVHKKRFCQAITAAALLMPRELFLHVGGFYPGYQNGFEDLDLCLHLVALGKKLLVEPAAEIIHLESQSPGRKNGEAANARLLTERCGRLYHADYHIHGLRDGFIPLISDALDIILVMRPEQEEALLQEGGEDDKKLAKLCASHPFCFAAKSRLADVLRQDGKYAMAAHVLADLASLKSDTDAYERLLSLEPLCQESPAFFAAARTDLAELTKRRNNRLLLRKAMSLASSWQDKALQDLLAKKERALRESAKMYTEN